MTAAGALATVLALAAANRGARTQVPVDIVDHAATYVVTATDAAGLAGQMDERGPLHVTGRRGWAHTGWELQARYALEPSPGACRLLDPRVVLDVTTTLPRWEPEGEPAARLRAGWSRMLRHAAAHEREHRAHAIDAAHAAAEGIARIVEARDCRGIERRVREVIRASRSTATRRSRLFDRDTAHGRRSGVRLVE